MGQNTVYVVLTDVNSDDMSVFSISTHEPAAHARAGQALAQPWCYSVTMLAWDTDTQESIVTYVWYRTEVGNDQFPCPECGHAMVVRYPCCYCRVLEREPSALSGAAP